MSVAPFSPDSWDTGYIATAALLTSAAGGWGVGGCCGLVLPETHGRQLSAAEA